MSTEHISDCDRIWKGQAIASGQVMPEDLAIALGLVKVDPIADLQAIESKSQISSAKTKRKEESV